MDPTAPATLPPTQKLPATQIAQEDQVDEVNQVGVNKLQSPNAKFQANDKSQISNNPQVPTISDPINSPTIIIPTQAVVTQTPPPSTLQPAPTSTTTNAVGQAIVSVNVPPQQPTPAPVGGVPKEQMIAPQIMTEAVPLVELREHEKIPEEVEGWMEKLEQAGEITIPEAIKKDEQVILDNATPTRVKDVVVMPLTQNGAVVAAKKSVTESARWLYEWCKRLAKMLGDRAKYKN
jgi:hypothetical protein